MQSIKYIVLTFANSGKSGMLYRIGLPSNTATPLSLFVRIELLCFCSWSRRKTGVATDMAAAVMANAAEGTIG